MLFVVFRLPGLSCGVVCCLLVYAAALRAVGLAEHVHGHHTISAVKRNMTALHLRFVRDRVLPEGLGLVPFQAGTMRAMVGSPADFQQKNQ